MKKSSLITSLIFIFLTNLSHARVRAENCAPEQAGSAVLYLQDFKWGYTIPELLARFVEIYKSDKRLKNRAYLDSSDHRLKLPYASERGGAINLDPQFVESVTKHIENAFEKKVIDGVFFPDMGHSHFLIPTEKYEKIYEPIPVQNMSKFYEVFFQDKDVKVLYHTAEQLKTLDENNEVLNDERVQYRFRTRNLVGSNNGLREIEFLQNPESAANTAHDLPGFHYWGAGFNLSANESGCFSYEKDGKEYYYDISLFDLESDPSQGEFQIFRDH